MNAYQHASFCGNVAKRISKEFNRLGLDVDPVFGFYYYNEEKTYAYMHPEDLYKKYDEIKYPHGDI
jgi:hypothetical protein